MRAFLKKLSKDNGGNVLVIAGAGTLALVGGAGLAVDTVQWYLWKRELQNAVDASAIAGAQALSQGRSYSVAATNELRRNEEQTTITIGGINNAPLSGAYKDDTAAVEVLGSVQQDLPFSSLFVSTGPTINARAVAKAVGNGEHCAWLGAETGTALKIGGKGSLKLGCGIYSNSKALDSVDFEGIDSYLYSSPLSARGGVQMVDSTKNVASGTAVQSYTVPHNNPFDGNYSMDNVPSRCDSTAGVSVRPGNTLTLSPETSGAKDGYHVFCGNVFVQGTLTLNPGVYVMDGGKLTTNAGAKIVGQGVTIILTGGATVDMSGGANVKLRAPTSAKEPSFLNPEWYGMLLYQDPDDPVSSSTLAGNAGTTFDGVVYAPNTDLTITGTSTVKSDCLMLVANRLTVTGDTDMNNACGEFVPGISSTGASIVQLVE